MARGQQIPPSYHQGYARNAGGSAYPDLWRGLVGAWVPALGVTGSILKDVSGFGHDGTFTLMDPTTDWIVAANPRMPGYALTYDGSDDKVTLGNSATLQLSVGTIITWINSPSNTNEYEGVVNKDNAYGIYLKSGVYIIFDWGASADRSTGVSVQDGENYSLALAFNSGVTNGTSLYIDGVNKLDTTMTIVDQNTQLVLGADDISGSEYYPGEINGTFLYDRILSPAEISLLYRVPLAPLILRSHLFVKVILAAFADPAAIGQLRQSGGMIGRRWQ